MTTQNLVTSTVAMTTTQSFLCTNFCQQSNATTNGSTNVTMTTQNLVTSTVAMTTTQPLAAMHSTGITYTIP